MAPTDLAKAIDLRHARALAAVLQPLRDHVDLVQELGLHHAQQIEDQVRVVRIRQLVRDLAGERQAHLGQAVDQGLPRPEPLDELRGHGRQQVTLGHRPAAQELRPLDDVLLQVDQRRAEAAEDLVGPLHHRGGALEPRVADGHQVLGHLVARRGGNALHRHVGDARGVRVVQLAGVHRRVAGGHLVGGVDVDAALEAGHRRPCRARTRPHHLRAAAPESWSTEPTTSGPPRGPAAPPSPACRG